MLFDLKGGVEVEAKGWLGREAQLKPNGQVGLFGLGLGYQGRCQHEIGLKGPILVPWPVMTLSWSQSHFLFLLFIRFILFGQRSLITPVNRLYDLINPHK